MQLNKINTIPPLNTSPYPLTPLNISFLCDLAPLRLCGIKIRTTMPAKEPQKRKKMTKKRLSKNTRNPLCFQGRPSFLLPLICKNEPNFKNLSINLTPETTDTYNDSNPENPQKNEPKTNPNEPNFRRPKESILSVVEGQNKPNPNPNEANKANPKPIYLSFISIAITKGFVIMCESMSIYRKKT